MTKAIKIKKKAALGFIHDIPPKTAKSTPMGRMVPASNAVAYLVAKNESISNVNFTVCIIQYYFYQSLMICRLCYICK